MKLLKQLALAALLIYVVVQIVVILPRHLNKEKEKEAAVPAASTEKKSEQILNSFTLVESKKGTRDWELFADEAVSIKDSGDWDLKKVTVQLYNKDAKEFTVKGDTGNIDSKTKNISVRGNVNIESYNGYVFTTDEVFYVAATRTIETESPIAVRGPVDSQGEGITMDGKGLEANVDTSKMLIKNNVVAHKKMKDGKDVDVKSSSALLNGRTKEVLFQGNVKVVYNFMEIESPSSNFKYSNNILEEILFDGGVKATQTDRKATSQQLLVRLKEQKLVFRGNPVLIEKEDELRGDQITLLEGGRKVKVEKVDAKGSTKPAPKK